MIKDWTYIESTRKPVNPVNILHIKESFYRIFDVKSIPMYMTFTDSGEALLEFHVDSVMIDENYDIHYFRDGKVYVLAELANQIHEVNDIHTFLVNILKGQSLKLIGQRIK